MFSLSEIGLEIAAIRLVSINIDWSFRYDVHQTLVPIEWLVILLTGIAIWGNTKACIDKIQEVQNNQAGDKEIAEYILSHREDENVYMIDDNIPITNVTTIQTAISLLLILIGSLIKEYKEKQNMGGSINS